MSPQDKSNHSDPPFDQYTGPYTIIFLEEGPTTMELRLREFDQREAVDAFIDGRKLISHEYIIVMGRRLHDPQLKEGK